MGAHDNPEREVPGEVPASLARQARSFLGDSATLFGSSLLSALFATAYVSVVGHALTPAAFGEVGTAIALVYFLSLVLGVLDSAVQARAASAHAVRDTQTLRRLAFETFAGRGAIVGLGLGLWAVLLVAIGRWLDLASDILLVLFIYAPPIALLTIKRAVLRGMDQFGAVSTNLLAESVARLVWGLTIVGIAPGPTVAFSGYIIGLLVALLLAHRQIDLPHGLERADLQAGTLLTFRPGPFVLYQVFFWAAVNVDVIIARRLLTPEEAGVYAAASTLARLLYIAGTPIYQVLMTKVAALASRNHPFGQMATIITAGTIGALMIGMAIPWVLGTWLLHGLFGPAYAQGADVLSILWASSSLLIVTTCVAYSLLASGGDNGPTAGWTAFLLPPVVMTTCLWHWNDRGVHVASASLATVSAGLAVALLMAGHEARKRSAQRPVASPT